MKLTVCTLLFLSVASPTLNAASVPVVEAQAETDPIPAGETDADDAAIWIHPSRPGESLILGTSKYDENGLGGLGVYDLSGHQKQFFPGSKLNSVDLVQSYVLGNQTVSLAIATNRSEQALDFYRIEEGLVSLAGRSLLRNEQGESFEPYGLCLAERPNGELDLYLPTKKGTLFQYRLEQSADARLEARWIRTIDLAARVSPAQDLFMSSLIRKEAQFEGSEDKLDKHLRERFILEGCSYDVASQKIYVGMENLGIWSVSLGAEPPQPELVIPVQGSWTDIDAWGSAEIPRVTDDIEGIDIVQRGDRSYLFFSSQGISEFTVYDLSDLHWIGNFKIGFGPSDPISLTDGLAIASTPLNGQYPEGILVVHDDQNTDKQGQVENGNYKLISMKDVWKVLESPIMQSKNKF